MATASGGEWCIARATTAELNGDTAEVMRFEGMPTPEGQAAIGERDAGDLAESQVRDRGRCVDGDDVRSRHSE